MLKMPDRVPRIVGLLKEIDGHQMIAGLETETPWDDLLMKQTRIIGHHRFLTWLENDETKTLIGARLVFQMDRLITWIEVVYDAVADGAWVVWDRQEQTKDPDEHRCFCAAIAAKKLGLVSGEKHPIANDAFIQTIATLVEHALGIAERDRVRA